MMSSTFTRCILQLLFLANLCTRIIAANNATITSETHTITSGGSSLSIAVNVPSDNQEDDLFFAVQGPAGNAWIAWGLGSGMAGSLIFVAYPSSDNKNVTVSPRLGTGHSMPKYTSDVKVTILEGTSYSANYTINMRCTNCRSWSGNSISITNTAQPMIWAVGPSGQMASNSLDDAISQHGDGDSDTFTMDFAKATGEGGVPQIQANSGDTTDFGPGGPDGRHFGPAAHALLMVGGFLVIFPAGYLALRVFEKVWLHWALQSFGAFIITVGSVAGIVISKKDDISPKLNHPHQIIGLIVLALLLITWIMGLLGHLTFRRQKISRATIPQKSHRFLGPGTMALGLANGAVGFSFAGRGIIVYVIACTVMSAGVSGIMIMKKRRMQRKAAMTTPAAYNFRDGAVESQSVPLQGMNGNQGPAAPPYYEAAGYYAPPPGRPGM